MEKGILEAALSKFKVLEVMNVFLGFYTLSVYALLWHFGTLPQMLVYLTPLLGIVLLACHMKLSMDFKKSALLSGSLLSFKFVSSTGLAFMLFLFAVICLILGSLLPSSFSLVLSMLFVLNHTLFISVDKNQIDSKIPCSY